MARGMAFEDGVTALHVRVADWYQVRAAGRRQGRGLCMQVAAKMASHAPGSCSAVRSGLTSGPSPWLCASTSDYCIRSDVGAGYGPVNGLRARKQYNGVNIPALPAVT